MTLLMLPLDLLVTSLLASESYNVIPSRICIATAHLLTNILLSCIYFPLHHTMASSSSKHRGCLNKTNSFCYFCGEFTIAAHRQTITPLLSTAYFHYFKCKIGDQDKSWAPHICCNSCYDGLVNWFKGKKVVFKFADPMVWREPPNHVDDCYFFSERTLNSNFRLN